LIEYNEKKNHAYLLCSFENGKQHVDQLQQEILNLRKELIRQSHSVEIENVRTELNKVLHSRDEWHEASTRFHRYFKCAKARLMVAESELRRRGLLKGNVKTALTSAWTSTEYNIQDIQGNLCDLLRDASTTLEELDKDMNDERDDVREYMKSLTQKSASSNGDEDDDSSTNDTAMIFEVINPSVKVLELKEEVDTLKRQLSNAEKEIQRLNESEKVLKQKCGCYILNRHLDFYFQGNCMNRLFEGIVLQTVMMKTSWFVTNFGNESDSDSGP
ncbi:hypothetical protein COOONC_27859, partial [Cooperia oncophora]